MAPGENEFDTPALSPYHSRTPGLLTPADCLISPPPVLCALRNPPCMAHEILFNHTGWK